MVRTGKEVNRKIALRASALLLSATALLANAAPVAAITDGQLDGAVHPNVGLLAAEIPGGYRAVCTGTLISPTVFLTAGHCTGYLQSMGFTRAVVTFDLAARGISTFYRGTLSTHPLFNQSQSDPADLGVLVLDDPITTIAPARLPALGLLDAMSAAKTLSDQAFTAVGYGAIGWYKPEDPIPGGKVWYNNCVDLELVAVDDPCFARRAAQPSFKALNDNRLHLSQNPALGDSGTCYGDSGGPNFLAGTDVIVGTTMTGDAVCKSTNIIYRLDTPTARWFLGNFVDLP
jgi:secreted trypsin-like serine protease